MIIKVLEENFYKAIKDLGKITKKFETNGYKFEYTHTETKEEIINHCLIKYCIFNIEADIFNQKWQFVALLEKENTGILIKGFETENHSDYLKKYTENIALYCEHCNQFRELKYAVVIQNKETKEYKTVGRSCLKKYTGSLSAEIIEKRYMEFEELTNNNTYMNRSSSRNYSNIFELKYVVKVAQNVIRKIGYVSNKNAFDTDKIATSVVVKAILNLLNDNNSKLLENKEVADLINNEEFLKKIENSNNNIDKIVEFINNKHNTESVFDNNIRTIFNNNVVNTDSIGMICFGVFEFEKSQNKETETEKSKSEYIGNVGEKITVDVVSYTLLAINYYEHWATLIYKLIDKTGNEFIWKTSKAINEEVFNIDEEEIINEPIKVNKIITGKVKEHKTFNNVKQTVITYVKVVK